MKVTMCFGTFDNFHPGHAFYLQQAASLGQDLLIVVARDKTVKRIKKHLPQIQEHKRLELVQDKIKDLGVKGKAILGDEENRYDIVIKHQPNIICLGYDQKADIEFLHSINKCEIKRIEAYHPEKYKSSFCVNYEDQKRIS